MASRKIHPTTRMLAYNIRVLRAKQGLSQIALAVEASTTPATISAIENREGNPTLEILQRLADVFVINKVDTADPDKVIQVRESLRRLNPTAIQIEGASPLFVDDPEAIRRVHSGRAAEMVGGREDRRHPNRPVTGRVPIAQPSE